jgi:hypothetical protein
VRLGEVAPRKVATLELDVDKPRLGKGFARVLRTDHTHPDRLAVVEHERIGEIHPGIVARPVASASM